MKEKIAQYITYLKEYNNHTNIYSETAYDKLDFHTQDSLTLAKIITNKRLTIFDFGSGSGLPAVPIAIKNPNNTIFAIESKSRKTKFLNQIKETLNLTNLTIITQNLFEWKAPNKPDIITAKAFAPVEKIQKLAKRHGRKHTKILIPISDQQKQTLEQNPSITIIESTPYIYAQL